MELENAGLSWCCAYPPYIATCVWAGFGIFLPRLLVNMHLSLRCILLAGRIMQSGSMGAVSGYACTSLLGQKYCHVISQTSVYLREVSRTEVRPSGPPSASVAYTELSIGGIFATPC